MRTIRRRFTSVLLVLLLIFPSGCNKEPKPDTNSPSTPMGRYIETEYSFPVNIYHIFELHQNKDGILELVCVVNESDNYHLSLLRSADMGKSWTTEDINWITEIETSPDNYDISAITWDSNDVIHLYYNKTDTSKGEHDNKQYMAYINEAGEIIETNFRVIFDTNGSGVVGMQLAQNGDYIFNCYFSLIHTDSEGNLKNTFTNSQGNEISSYYVNETTLYYADDNRIQSFNLETNQQLDDIICNSNAAPDASKPNISNHDAPNNRILTTDPEGSIYYADNNGLYRCLPQNTMQERIMDGGLTSLSTPTYLRTSMIVTENSYLLLCFLEEKYTLLSYSFSPDVPTVPSTELKIYSLYDNLTIRQAIGSYQRENANIYINYQTGMAQEGGSSTVSDVLRALSTQMLAGSGPDILVLDGMPIDSYISMGALTELSSDVKTLILDNALLPEVSNAFLQQDQTYYAIPARMEVPMMQGTKEAISSIHSLEDMVNWMERSKDSYQKVLNITSPQLLIREFYPLYASSLFQEAKVGKTTQLSYFLTNIKRVMEINGDASEQYDSNWTPEYSFNFDALLWQKDIISLNIGNINTFTDTFAANEVMKQKEGSIASLLNQNTFIPKTILGISSQSTQIDLAKQFMFYVLSDSVQVCDLNDGMPVTSSAIDTITEISPQLIDERFSFYGMSYQDSNNNEISITSNIFWPSQQYADEINQLLKTSKPVKYHNDTILHILLDETVDYFNNTEPLEECIDKIRHKLNLYLSE